MPTRRSAAVRYAVVGLGHIAQVAVLPAFAHARHNSRLVALVSGDPSKLRTLKKKYRVEPTKKKEPDKKKNGHASNKPKHDKHEHGHGAHPHGGGTHHHHQHPHPHLSGPNGHHHA